MKDFNAALVDSGVPILFEVEDMSVHDLDSKKPKIKFRHEGKRRRSNAISSAAATASTAFAGRAFRQGALQLFDREYPFGWLGILSESPPPDHELIYSYTERGFALYTMRSPTRVAALSPGRSRRGHR